MYRHLCVKGTRAQKCTHKKRNKRANVDSRWKRREDSNRVGFRGEIHRENLRADEEFFHHRAKFARVLYGKKCDQSIAGTWTQVSRVPSSTTTVSDEDEKTTDSLCPLLSGLGAPAFVCGIVDRLTTTLTISCTDEHTLRVVDKTPLTKENVTETGLRGIGKEETRCKTKGGRKEYMLSGDVKMDGTNQFACRLISRGDGWWTISERSLTDESGKYLRERNILRAPGKKDVVVDRYFERSK